MMHICVQASARKTPESSASMPIHTTLYDLIAVIAAEAGPDADDAVTATVMHVLDAYRVTCLGDFEGCQMICDEEERSYSAVA